MNRTHTALIFGESGVGKSSIVNMLFDENKAVTSDAAIGCTFQHEKYSMVHEGENVLQIFDTVGLSEADKGLVKGTEAISNLVQLLDSLGEGINIIIHCIKKGTILQSSHNNYNIFVEGMCKNKVPVILAVTGCEQDDPMNKWWEGENSNTFTTNKDIVLNRFNMKQVKACVCMTTIRDGLFADCCKPKYIQSRNELFDQIFELSLKKPFKMDNSIDWVSYIVTQSWNVLAESFGLKSGTLPVDKFLYNAYQKIGLDKKSAKIESNKYAGERKNAKAKDVFKVCCVFTRNF